MTRIFIRIKDNVAFAVGNGYRGNFVIEAARLLGGFGLVLGTCGKCVLLFARDAPLVGNVFCGVAHVIAVKRAPQTILDHAVDEFDIAHFMACA